MRWMLLNLLFLSSTIFAAENCVSAQFEDAQGNKAYVWEKTLSEGQRELVMAIVAPDKATEAEIHRITFGGKPSAECRFNAAIVIKGGDWGWQIAWSEAKGVFYARMDGEAWVSSPAKKLSAKPAQQLSFEADGQVVRLKWQSAESAEQGIAESQDEGRSW